MCSSDLTKGQLEIDQMVTRLEPFLDAVDPAALQKLGATVSAAIEADPERPLRILSDAETTLHNTAVASAELPGLLREAHTTLASIQRAADEARPILSHANQTLAEVDTRINAVDPQQVPTLLHHADGAAVSARQILSNLDNHTQELNRILSNLQDLDKWELRRLLREEGIVVRLRPNPVEVPEEARP